jgi:Flp pilus assembly protein TadG
VRTSWGLGRGMIKRQETGSNFAGRMARLMVDTTGNAMMIMGVALIPIIGIVGSAFDMGRAYMVKTRLQQACDAGALAGRRNMTTDQLDATSEQLARSFFRNNFPTGTFGTTGLAFTPLATSDGQVTATATATVPMTLMRLFKKPAIPLTVACEAILEVANTDIMFVLDVTGSMNCPTATTNSDCNLVEDTNSKIKALRNAVVSFYTTLNAAISKDARLRFGFVPYSTTVNVGKSLPAAYLKTTWGYQSRERRLINWTTGTTTAGTWPASNATTPAWSNYSAWTLHSSTTVSGSSSCTAPATTYSSGTVVYGTPSSGTADGSTGAVTISTPTSRITTETSYQKTYTSSNKNCKIEVRTRTRTETSGDSRTDTPNYDWDYKRVIMPEATLTSFKTGSVTLNIENATDSPANGPGQPASFSWDGCIEERQASPDATFTTLPTAAYDLNIDFIPTSAEETRWAPAWKEIIWRRNQTSTAAPDPGTLTTNAISGSGIQRIRDVTGTDRNSYSCPKAAQKLKVMTLDEVKAYVNVPTVSDFKARGYTYHDVGMIWGARFISPDGIFGNENKAVPTGEKGAGKPINRHIIFMTDGQMDTDATAYGLYGLEMLDRRVNTASVASTNNDTRHNNRFAAVCAAAKAKNITVWVVAYASTLTTQLSSCATSGKSFTASNDAQLQQQFQTIANKIAELRLSK